MQDPACLRPDGRLKAHLRRREPWKTPQAVIMYLVTGTLDAPELALALTGMLNAVVVYEVPNAEEG